MVGSTYLTKEEYLRIKPYAIQVEHLIRIIIEYCDADLKLALSVATRFGPLMQSVLGDKGYISLAVPDADQVKPQATSPADSG